MGMVSQAIVKIVGDDSHLAATLKRANASMDASEKKFNQDFGRITQSVQRGALALTAFGVAAGYMGVKAVRSAADAEAIWKRLDGTLANAGVSFGAVRGEIENTADRLQKFTRFGDEETAGVLQRLVAVTGDYRRSLQNVELVMDVAIGTQMDLDAAAKLVGKGMVGVTQEFKRYGIVIKEGESATDALKKKFGGLAREDGQTLEAQLNRIADAADDLFEALGGAIAGDNAAKSIGGIADAIKALADTIEANRAPIHTFFTMLGAIPGLAKDAFMSMPGMEGAAIVGRAGGVLKQRADFFASDRAPTGGYDALRGIVPFAQGFNLGAPTGATGFRLGTGFRPAARTPSFPVGRFPENTGPGIPRAPRITLDPIDLSAPSLDTFGRPLPGMDEVIRQEMFARRAQMAGGQIAGIASGNAATMGALENRLADKLASDLRTRASFREHAGFGATGGAPGSRISTSQWLGAGASAAQAIAGMATGRMSALGGLSSLLATGGQLAPGPLGIGLQGASMAVSLFEGIFGSKQDQEERQMRAHLRALREARREQQTVFRIVLPAGTGRPDHAYLESLSESLIEIQGNNVGGHSWEFVRE